MCFFKIPSSHNNSQLATSLTLSTESTGPKFYVLDLCLLIWSVLPTIQGLKKNQSLFATFRFWSRLFFLSLVTFLSLLLDSRVLILFLLRFGAGLPWTFDIQ
jgi:hypothetical protein